MYNGTSMGKLINREKYLKRLISTIQTNDIKVITGVRRSGKSKLISLFKEYIKSLNSNIIEIDFNNSSVEKLNEYHSLEKYIEDAYVPNKENFVLIDEVQMCSGFEKAINSLHNKEKYHIYITGSNAFLLSSDLATLFTGRTFEIHVYPFSFEEFKCYFNYKENYPAFDEYIKIGGMAGCYDYKSEEERKTYLSSIFKTSIIRDISNKYHIKNKQLLNKVAMFLSDNISNISSNRNIALILNSNKEKINHKTIGSYLEYLENSFLFYKLKRYDIKGKKYLLTTGKYYLSDHSFKYALTGTKNIDTGRALENIVAIELLRRGFEVYSGNLYKKEIDFVAIKNGERLYIQVSDDIQNKNTFNRETTSLLSINDAYPKILIARTRSESYQFEGIKVIDIAEWLLDNK